MVVWVGGGDSECGVGGKGRGRVSVVWWDEGVVVWVGGGLDE